MTVRVFCRTNLHPESPSTRGALEGCALKGVTPHFSQEADMRKPIVAGNWKLNGSRESARTLLDGLLLRGPPEGVQLVVFPPALYLAELVTAYADSPLEFGAQDVSEHTKGAYTGELSAAMLVDVGASWTLVGHSERRIYQSESSDLVARKARAAVAGGLRVVVCVGESREQRECGATEAVLRAQLAPVLALGREVVSRCVLAYEPVWAIGTGLTASPEQAQDAHAFIRSEVAAVDANMADSLVLLYGGSVKPENAAALFAQPDVDGGLIGGASLVADDFLRIAAAAAVRR
jgi:triosephosphate isomerase